MNYIITGGTGFIGTHLTNLIAETYPNASIYNLDIVEPGTPLPTVKNYKPALKEGEEAFLGPCTKHFCLPPPLGVDSRRNC